MPEPNVTGIVELAGPENHTIEPKIAILSYTLPKSEQSLTDSIKLLDPENPLVGASIWR